MDINFIGGMYAGRSTAFDGQECVNWYPEAAADSENAKSATALLPTPGLTLFARSSASGPVRALYVTGTGRMFGVIGSTLSEFTESGIELVRGTLGTSAGYVSMADNGSSPGRGIGLLIVDGCFGYFLNLSTGIFTRICDAGFPQCSSAVFLDGYFIVNENGTGKLWCSNPYNGLDWGDADGCYASSSTLDMAMGLHTIAIDKNLAIGSGAASVAGDTAVIAHSVTTYMTGEVISYEPTSGNLAVYVKECVGIGSWSDWTLSLYAQSTKYAFAESNTDPVVALRSVHNELWVFGTQSLEVWYNSGAADFPFTRTHGASNTIGTVAPASIAASGNTVFWLGSNAQGHGAVWQASDYNPGRVSPAGIDCLIEKMPSLQDAAAYCYSQAGHCFYVLSFPSGNVTLCCDVTTGIWHQRAGFNSLEGTFERHKGACACFFGGKTIVGDYASGLLYWFDLENYTDNGKPVRRVRTGPHMHADCKRLYFNGFEADVERGVGLSNGQGSNPQVFLQWSDDGGSTWSSEHWASPGRQGNYTARMRWNRLGCSRNRVFRLTVCDPVKTVLIAARADVEVEG